MNADSHLASRAVSESCESKDHGQRQKMYTGLSSLQASPEAKAIEVIYNKVNVNIMFLMLLKLVLLLYITLDQQG